VLGVFGDVVVMMLSVAVSAVTKMVKLI